MKRQTVTVVCEPFAKHGPKFSQLTKNGEPSLHQFLQKFGSTLQRALIDLPALTPEDLISQISNTANSSPSLDRWTRNELHSLSLWCPTMFQHLCTLLNQIENGMPWPDLLTIGAVSFIPKDVEGGIATPLQHRPITVLRRFTGYGQQRATNN